MARAQYQGSARAGGYRPQQVDERNIARMREESNRVINGMQQVAKAEIQNRERVAQAMKENAAATAKQQQLNFQIQTQNSQNRLQGLQAQASTDQQQFNIDQAASETIFKSIATLSAAAGKKVEEIQQARKEEEYKREYYDQDPNANAITQLLRYKQESAGRVAAQARLSGIQLAEANGADPSVAAKLKAQDPITQYDFTDATISKFFRFQYVDERNARLAAAEKEKGTPLSYEEKKQIVAQLRDDIYGLVGANGLSSDLVKPHLSYADEADAALYSSERTKQQKEDDERRGDTHLTILNNTEPTKRQEVFNSSFPHLVDVYGYKGALDKLQQSVFNVQDPKTGEFYWTMDAIQNLVIPTEGKTIGQKYSDKNGNPTGRLAEIQSERIKLDLQFRKQQMQIDDVSHAEVEQQLFRAFQLNPTAKNAEEAQRMYVSLTGKESTMLSNASKHLTYEAQHKKNVISAASKLRDFELTPEVVAGVCSIDPTGCKPLKERADAYNAKWKSESYKDSEKSIESAVSGTTSFGTTKAAQAGALPMISYLKANVRNRAGMYEAALGFEAAHQKAAAELVAEYRNGYRDPNSIYYRKTHRNGTVSYPNLPTGNVAAADQIKREISEIKADAKSGGIDSAIQNYFTDHPERAEYIKNNYNKPTFQPTPQELALKGMANGMPLHALYNRGFEKIGDSTRLASPLQSNGKDLVLTASQLKTLNDPYAGPNAKLSVINSVLNPGMFQNPSTMRPGSAITNQLTGFTGVPVSQTKEYPITLANGQPIRIAKGAASNSFDSMLTAGMPTEGITNVFRDEAEYNRLKREGYSPALGGYHNYGLAIDAHGAAGKWLKENGAEYGWAPEPGYTGHGGHYIFTGK